MRGRVVLRGEENRNPRIPSGDVEVVAAEIEILNAAHPLPFPVDDDAELRIGGFDERRFRVDDESLDHAGQRELEIHPDRALDGYPNPLPFGGPEARQ